MIRAVIEAAVLAGARRGVDRCLDYAGLGLLQNPTHAADPGGYSCVAVATPPRFQSGAGREVGRAEVAGRQRRDGAAQAPAGDTTTVVVTGRDSISPRSACRCHSSEAVRK